MKRAAAAASVPEIQTSIYIILTFVIILIVLLAVFLFNHLKQEKIRKSRDPEYQRKLILKNYLPIFLYKDLHKHKSRFIRSSQQLDDKFCTICLLVFIDNDKVRQAICGHLFHRKCFDKWFHKQTNCPNCRQEMTLDAIKDKFGMKQPQILNDRLESNRLNPKQHNPILKDQILQ